MSSDEFYREVGRRLREAREEAGLTQAEVARVLGLTDAAYNRYETAERRIRISDLRRVAEILGKPPAWFMGVEVDPNQVFYWRYRHLSPENRAKVDEYTELLLEQQQRREREQG